MKKQLKKIKKNEVLAKEEEKEISKVEKQKLTTFHKGKVQQRQGLLIVQPNPDQASSTDSSCWTKLAQDRIKTNIQQLGYRTLIPRDNTTNQPCPIKFYESDQFPLLNDPKNTCIYVIKEKAWQKEVLIAQGTHKTSLNR